MTIIGQYKTAAIGLLRPSFYDDHNVVLRPTFGKACSHLLTLCLLLALPSSCMMVLRVAPAASALRWGAAIDSAATLFPEGLELVLNGSTLHVRPSPPALATQNGHQAPPRGGEALSPRYVCWSKGEQSWCASATQLGPIRVALPPLLHDLCYTDMPAPLRLSPARLLELWGMGIEGLGELEMDGFPPLVEFEVGEAVEVLHGAHAFLWGRGWQPAVVHKKHPAKDVSHYFYSLELADGTPVQKRGEFLRRTPSVVLAHDDVFTALPDEREAPTPGERLPKHLRRELLELHADMVLMPHQVHRLQGFSFEFAQYWQYRAARRATLFTTRQPVSAAALRTYQPWALVLKYLCHAPEEEVTTARLLPPRTTNCPLLASRCPRCPLHTTHSPGRLSVHRPTAPPSHSPLPTAHCPLPSAHCPLPSALCPLPTAHCPLPQYSS